MKALVIDDSKALRRILRGILSGIGFEVIEAADGKEGLEQVTKYFDEIDVVLVDWNMPVMNGIEFIEACRAEPRFEGLKIVMVTTETEPERMVKALLTGVDEFVMKPFKADMLIDKLKLIGVQAISAEG